jgi:hypothetical protein
VIYLIGGRAGVRGGEAHHLRLIDSTSRSASAAPRCWRDCALIQTRQRPDRYRLVAANDPTLIPTVSITKAWRPPSALPGAGGHGMRGRVAVAYGFAPYEKCGLLWRPDLGEDQRVLTVVCALRTCSRKRRSGISPSFGRRSLVRGGRTSRCRRARLSQLLMGTPTPIMSDKAPYEKPESCEGRR